MRKFIYILLIIGIFIASTTELLDDMVQIGGVYWYPNRIYLLFTYILLLLLLSVTGFKTKASAEIKKIRTLFFLFSFIVLLSVFKSPDILYSLKKSFFAITLFLFPIIIFYLLQLTNVRRKKAQDLLKYYVYGGALLALFGIIQEFTGLFLTETNHRAVLGVDITRINSLFHDANFFGYYLLIPLFLNNQYVIYNKLLRYLFFSIIFVAILLTGSQGTLLALFIGTIYIIVSKYSSYDHIKYKVLALSPFLIIYYIVENTETLLNDASSAGFDTGVSRILSWSSGLSMFKDNLLLGIGPGNFVTSNKATLYLQDFVPKYRLETFDKLAAHSNYIEIATESGIFALMLYILIFIYLLKLLDRYSENNPLFKYLAGLIVATLVATVTLSYIAYFYFLLLGIILYVIERDVIIRKHKINEYND